MSQSPQNTCKMTAATKLLGEMCHLTAQSLTMMNTSEHFQVLKLLGEGSYGKVMLAVHRKRGGDHRKANMTLQLENPCKNNIILCLPGTPMALKFFSRESTSLYSFLKEYNFSLSFCSHPSLTSALGIAYFTPSHYIFAQQAGLFGDLYNVILPEIGMEEDCCQRVVSQLCGALSHLHSLGFVHRDLKPENVFLFDAACRWVKLGDYGMVKARGTRVPEVWYSSPYCTPEAEIARENRDNWNGSNDNNNDTKEDRGKQSKSRVWVFVEPSTDSWALGIITYAMLTGTHPWAQTSSDCLSYQKYIEWFQSSKGPVDETDVWAEPKQDVPGTIEAGYDKGGYAPVAPQFTCFTPLAHAFFHLLLDPSPQCRGHPEDVLRYLGGDWMTDVERARLEKERKKSKEKGTVKEMEG